MCTGMLMLWGCQPIVAEPPPSPPVEQPPRIVRDFLVPQQPILVESPTCATDGTNKQIAFSVGEVEDDDLTATLTERWGVDYDPTKPFPILSPPIQLQRFATSPAFATDQQFLISLSSIYNQNEAAPTTPHLIQVWVSDGFADSGDPNKAAPGKVVVEADWYVQFDSSISVCPGVSQ